MADGLELPGLARIVAVSDESFDVAYLVLQGDPATSKSRLSAMLSREQRQRLTRYCLERVRGIVGNDNLFMLAENRAAVSEGQLLDIKTIQQHGDDLNSALAAARSAPELCSYQAAIVIPNDLPFLVDLGAHQLGPFDRQCLITPDTHLSGTNLLRVPISFGQPIFSFGLNSFSNHVRAARAQELEVRVAPCPNAMDLDTPNDLILAQEIFPEAELWRLL
jgi:2-phospho-L-lactate guanylyltransferase